MSTVIDEIVRYRSPLHQVSFHAASDVKLGGVKIPEGDRVIAFLGSANRDPRQFDDPDTFIPDRKPNHHIGFLDGPQFCLGAPFARMEGKVAFLEFFDRFEAIDLDMAAAKPSLNPQEYSFRSVPITVERS